MLGSAVLETAIGLVLTFALLAVFCSGICESIAGFLQMRARYLLTGLRLMLDHSPTQEAPQSTSGAMSAKVTDADEATRAYEKVNALAEGVQDMREPVREAGLTLAIFGHPLLQSLQLRTAQGPVVRVFNRMLRRTPSAIRNPSYLSPQMFSRTLLDTLVPDGSGAVSMTAINTTIENLPAELPARKSLQTLANRAEGDLTAFERLVEEWYDDQMQRVSGWYKRWAKFVLAGVGLIIAVLANVDTLQITHNLYVDQPIRQAVVAQADSGALCQTRPDPASRQACADQELGKLNAAGLPIWWQGKCLHGNIARCFRYTDAGHTGAWNVIGKLVGWGLTAFAVSFGAPFWFQALSRLGSLRNSGPPPPAAATRT
jgi:hypothetical protein